MALGADLRDRGLAGERPGEALAPGEGGERPGVAGKRRARDRVILDVVVEEVEEHLGRGEAPDPVGDEHQGHHLHRQGHLGRPGHHLQAVGGVVPGEAVDHLLPHVEVHGVGELLPGDGPEGHQGLALGDAVVDHLVRRAAQGLAVEEALVHQVLARRSPPTGSTRSRPAGRGAGGCASPPPPARSPAPRRRRSPWRRRAGGPGARRPAAPRRPPIPAAGGSRCARRRSPPPPSRRRPRRGRRPRRRGPRRGPRRSRGRGGRRDRRPAAAAARFGQGPLPGRPGRGHLDLGGRGEVGPGGVEEPAAGPGEGRGGEGEAQDRVQGTLGRWPGVRGRQQPHHRQGVGPRGGPGDGGQLPAADVRQVEEGDEQVRRRVDGGLGGGVPVGDGLHPRPRLDEHALDRGPHPGAGRGEQDSDVRVEARHGGPHRL